MLRIVFFMLMTILCLNSQAQTVKVFWKCSDKHLVAMENEVDINGEKIKLFLNYSLTKQQGLHFSPINTKSLADLPDDIGVDSYIMLGSKGQWLINCVGQVTFKPHYKLNKLIFDVTKNAYGCPLIPKNCATKKAEVVLLQDN